MASTGDGKFLNGLMLGRKGRLPYKGLAPTVKVGPTAAEPAVITDYIFTDYARASTFAWLQTFSPSGTTGQLQISGSNVTSNAYVSELIHTDWQGDVRLSTASRTNYALYSQDFSNGVWTQGNCSITGSQTAPDGTSTAWLITDDGTTNEHYIRQDVTLSGGNYFVKVRVKAGTLTTGNIQVNNNGTWTVTVVNLSTGAITSGPGSSSTIGSGWYEIEIPVSFVSGTFQVVIETGSGSHAGSGQTIYAWGVEVATADGAYILTTSAAASITDYSYTSAGAVTLGASATGTYVWSGTGTVSAGGSGTATPSGVSLTLAQNAPTASGTANGTATPSGVATTIAQHAPTATGSGTVSVTGVSTTISQHAPTATGTADGTATPSGVSTTLNQNAPTATGFGTVSVTGVSTTVSINAPSGTGSGTVTTTGVSTTISQGTPTASGGTVVDGTATPSGVATTISQNAPSGSVTATPNGVQTTVSQHAPSGSVSVTATPSGVQTTLSVNAPTGSVSVTATPAGVQTTLGINAPTASGSAVASPAGQQMTLGINAPSGNGSAVASPSGQAMTLAVGTATATGGGSGDGTAFPDGVVMTLAVGDATAEGTGQPIVNPVYPVASAGGFGMAVMPGMKSIWLEDSEYEGIFEPKKAPIYLSIGERAGFDIPRKLHPSWGIVAVEKVQPKTVNAVVDLKARNKKRALRLLLLAS